MKVKTWIPQKRKIAKTLADVPSSAESPVLCWNLKGTAILSMFSSGVSAKVLHKDGRYEDTFKDPSEFQLYHQPPQPKSLDGVPERWIVQAESAESHSYTYLWFWDGEKYWKKNTATNDNWKCGTGIGFTPASDWQLTDCEAVLVEVDVEVMG